MSSNNDKWGTAQNERLMQLRAEGTRPMRIAEIMNCSVTTIYYKLELFARKNSKPAKKQKRLCLSVCNQEFLSNGPGNRICPTCSKRDQNDLDSPSSFSFSRSL